MIRIAPSYLLLLLATLLFAGGVWWLILPQLSTLTASRALLIQPEAATAGLKQSSGSELSKANLHQQVLQLMPADDDQYDLAVEVEGLSRSAGVSLTGLSMLSAVAAASGATGKAAPVASGPKQLNLTLGVAGSYGAVQAFVSGLPTLSRFVSITQLTMTGGGQTKNVQGDSVTASLTATAPYLPQANVTKK